MTFPLKPNFCLWLLGLPAPRGPLVCGGGPLTRLCTALDHLKVSRLLLDSKSLLVFVLVHQMTA